LTLVPGRLADDVDDQRRPTMASDHVTGVKPQQCCPLPPGVPPLAVSPGEDVETLVRLSRWAHALSDPIRLRMLDLMARAQECCRPGEDGGPGDLGEIGVAGEHGRRGAPASSPAGVCVCELQSLQGLAQSKVSYHLRVLREAGLVREQRRGKWSFYSLDEETAEECAAAVRRQLGR
jgi:ArsR family transcriptional regulator, arsenate/arsenite/antimonite-responsive transcriptional repressor